MDLRKQYDVATDATFNERVAMALYTVAREVISEDPETRDHPLRVRFAQGIVTSDVKTFSRFASMTVADPIVAVMPQGTSAANITDAVILEAIRNMWNPMAGAV